MKTSPLNAMQECHFVLRCGHQLSRILGQNPQQNYDLAANKATTGFVETSLPFGKTSKDRHYRLIDEYCDFYLPWIAPNKRKAIHWENLQDSPAWRAWCGYVFESLCRRHLVPSKKA